MFSFRDIPLLFIDYIFDEIFLLDALMFVYIYYLYIYIYVFKEKQTKKEMRKQKLFYKERSGNIFQSFGIYNMKETMFYICIAKIKKGTV